MAAEERWYFSREQLENTPSKKCGIDPEKELSYRQQAANFIQDMGQRLQVNQLCINTSIVYMHRFYMFHSFQKFHRNAISTCALFLAAKVEEQPRKLEHVIKVAHLCLHRDAPALDPKSEAYLEQAQELVINENIMLQTLGFDVAIDHPHTHVVKCCQLVRGGWSSVHQHHASKDLAQTSYFMATNSLHLTTMCLQYKPTVVACVCIHLACKWANWEIPRSSEGKRWFWYVDKTVTEDLLEELTAEFLAILDRCPSRLKRKMMNASTGMEKMPDPSSYGKKNAEGSNASGGWNRSSPSTSGIDCLGASTSKADHFNTPLPALVRENLFAKMGASSSKTVNAADKNGGLAPQASSSSYRKPKKELPQNPAHPSTSVNSSSAAALPSCKQESLKTLPDHRHGTAPNSPPSPPSPTDFPRPSHNSTESYLQPPPPPSQQHQTSPLSGNGSSSNNNNSNSSSSSAVKKLKPSSKEYREYMEQVKNRERAEKEREKQPLPPQPPSSTLSSSSNQALPFLNRIEGLTIGNTPLSSLNLQPVVSLTQINPSCLEKLTAPRPQPNKPHHKTPEKQKSFPTGASAATPSVESEKSKHHHHHHHHPQQQQQPPQPPRGDEKPHGQKQHHQGNHVGRSHRLSTPSKAAAADPHAGAVLSAKPPILTPSPPPTRGEEFHIPKMDVATPPKMMHENPAMATPPTPLMPVSCEAPTLVRHPAPKGEHHRRKEREESGGARLPAVEPPPPPQRRHEAKDPKERQVKPHKSKTPPVIMQPPPPQQQQILELPSLQKPVVKAEQVEALRPSSAAPQPPPQPTVGSKPDYKHSEQEISRTVAVAALAPPPQQHHQPSPPTAPASNAAAAASNGSSVAKNSSSSLNETARLPQPHSRLPPTPQVAPSAATTREAAEPIAVPAVNAVPQPPPPPPEGNERHSAAAAPKQPHQSSKREKRHKSKSRDRDKERPHDKKESGGAPAIKLLIPKERLNLSAASVGGSSKHSSEPPPPERSGSLKLKISKEMLSESGMNSSGKTNSFAASVPAAAPPVPRETPAAPQPPPPAPPPPEAGCGTSLKIKITKDRAGGTNYNLSVGTADSSSSSTARKRDHPASRNVPGPPEGGQDDARPAKMPRQSVRASRRSGDNGQQQHGQQLDVPPSSNTRSSRQEPGYPQVMMHQQHMPPQQQQQQRGRKGGMKPMGMPHPPPPPPSPYGHQVNLGAGGYPPYAQYYPPYGAPPPPNYYMHPGEFPHPQFFNQFGPPPPPHMQRMQFAHPPPHLMQQPQQPPLPQQQQQQQPRSMPPLPREPPPVIPPPPPE